MPSFLHAKVAVIDDLGFIGSSSLDPFSLLLAREANVLVDDQAFVYDLKEKLEIAIRSGGRFITPVDYQHRGVCCIGLSRRCPTPCFASAWS